MKPLGALLLLLVMPGMLLRAAPVIVGYLPDYRLPGFAKEQLTGVTDLMLFSVSLAADGTLSEGPLAPGHRERLAVIRQGYRGRVFLTIGGWERSQGFAKVSATATRRRVFIRKLVRLARANQLGGIDYDWEHPKGAQEMANYAALIRETNSALSAQRGLVTVAQAAWQDLGKEVYEAVDRVHLMAYDHAYPQATFAKTKADVDRVIGFGCPADKLALGIPFYGRNKAGGAKTFAELSGFGDERDGYALNGPETVRRKMSYAKERGLAGIMIWELAQDAPGAHSLLTVIRRAW